MKKTVNKKPVAKNPIASKQLAANVGSNRPVPAKSIIKPRKDSWLGALAVGNIIGFVIVLIVNYLAVSIPLGGMTTGQLADLYPNLFVPTALTFSIRGLIYLLLLGFVIWQAVDFFKKQSTGITKKVGMRFLLSCIANIGRMFAWQYQYVVLSVAVIVFFLITLIVLAQRVEIGKKIGNMGDKYLVQVPFSIYLGRLSVATIANVTAMLVHFRWNMFGMTDIFRTIAVIIVATVLALLSLRKNSNIMFALVVIRAFIGIIIKRVQVDPVYARSIIRTLGICIAIISAGIGAKFKQRKDN